MKIKQRISSKKRIRACGFRKRMKTSGGRKVLNRRRRNGCHKISFSKPRK